MVSSITFRIDTTEHQGALSGGTAALLAGGNHIICARKKADPYDRLVEGGALIAESSIDTQTAGA